MTRTKTSPTLLLLLVVVAALTASARLVTAFQSPLPLRPSYTYATPTTTTRLPMAFGLPDEERQLPQPVADETLKSLVKKLDKSKSVADDTMEELSTPAKKKKDNTSMAFLRKIGRVGGAANKSFVNAVGSDEGSTGRQPAADTVSGAKKSKAAYIECTKSGVIDDLSEPFPTTSSGREWRGITDRVMGGRSNGQLRREVDLEGRPANVLVGHVSLANNGGFLQMVTDLSLDASQQSVDASEYDGMEVDVLYRSEDNNSFNVHLRTPGTFQQASYRYTFSIAKPNTWETIRMPFSVFEAHGGGPDMPDSVDPAQLRRIGIVGIGQEMDLFLAVSGVRFYSVI